VKVPLAKVALPARPTAPTSVSDQREGRGRPLLAAAVTVRVTVMELVKAPDVPVTVTVAVPVVAVLLAIIVNVAGAVGGLVLNEAVTPLGRPEADKLTMPLKPFCGVTVTLLVPLVPWVTLKVLGETESAKFDAALIVTETVVFLLKPLAVPVTVKVNVVGATVPPTVIVRVLEVAVGLVLNEAVTPLGWPEADKLTLPVKPFCGITVIVLVPPVAWVMFRVLGEAERL